MAEATPQLDFKRYLAAKRSVEDRALNLRVWEAMRAYIGGLEAPVKVLELGAGIGSMALRFAQGGLVKGGAYTLVEQTPELLEEAQAQLKGVKGLDLEFLADDMYAVLERGDLQVDLVVGHALLDLLDLKQALPRILGALKEGGAFYFPINYDGLSIFEPPVEPEFERALLARYHLSMDQRVIDRRPSGDSRTGRHLIPALGELGAEVLAAGSSDWLVYARDGAYPADEAYFLYFILDTIGREMEGLGDVDQTRLADWLSQRRRQVERGELLYMAHQLDVFGRV